MTTKDRVDIVLVERGFYPSREQARAAIMAGLVLVDNEPVTKAGEKVSRDANIVLKGPVHPYVSRGGLKLERAIHVFGIALDGQVVVDVGASTGGFTDCALQNGASLVYAIDVGYGQLAWKLRQDPRVITMERTNVRYLQASALTGPPPSVAVMDVSFISIRLLLPVLRDILIDNGLVITLIKPQFEAGKQQVGKKGVVRDPDVHREVIRRVLESARHDGFTIHGLTYSPITGGDGNIEFLALLSKDKPGLIPLPEEKTDRLIDDVIAEAHSQLGQRSKE